MTKTEEKLKSDQPCTKNIKQQKKYFLFTQDEISNHVMTIDNVYKLI